MIKIPKYQIVTRSKKYDSIRKIPLKTLRDSFKDYSINNTYPYKYKFEKFKGTSIKRLSKEELGNELKRREKSISIS